MRDMLLLVFGGFLALFTELLANALLGWLLRPKNIRRVILLPLFGGENDLEARLRWELFHLEKSAREDRLLAVIDMGLDDGKRAIAQKMLMHRSDAVLCDRENLRFVIGNDKVYKELEFVLYYN